MRAVDKINTLENVRYDTISMVMDIHNHNIKWFLVFLGTILISSTLTLFIIQSMEQPFINTHRDVVSSVVNIYCADGEKKTHTGSGTIISKDGLILTNSHVIHELGHAYTPTDDHTCIIAIPDPMTGLPDQVYSGHSIFSDTISDRYDLAFVQIDGPYYDEDGMPQGQYPTTFNSYTNKKQCGDPMLSELLWVYGYPSLVGGYALTVTDGVVSAILKDEGLIVTSAKVSRGNSGGLAVNEDGCIIGIPSIVKSNEIETYGIIYSHDLVSEFISMINKELGRSITTF